MPEAVVEVQVKRSAVIVPSGAAPAFAATDPEWNAVQLALSNV